MALETLGAADAFLFLAYTDRHTGRHTKEDRKNVVIRPHWMAGMEVKWHCEEIVHLPRGET